MRLQIFDVEHGACALLTADNNTRIMIDCGHNASNDWMPGTYLRQQGISTLEMLIVTNYDEDHASGANDLFDNISVKWLWRNKSVTGAMLKQLKSEDGMGPGIERLAYAMDHVFIGDPALTPEPHFEGLDSREVFCSSYPTFDDENNLSMAVFLKCRGVGVMFTGDLEKPGFAELLKMERFRNALIETRVYVASHHGRKNGCSEDIVPYLTKVNYVIISDRGYMYETQETIPFYRAIAKGGPFRGEKERRVLTTRADGRIGFEFNAGSWWPY